METADKRQLLLQCHGIGREADNRSSVTQMIRSFLLGDHDPFSSAVNTLVTVLKETTSDLGHNLKEQLVNVVKTALKQQVELF